MKKSQIFVLFIASLMAISCSVVKTKDNGSMESTNPFNTSWQIVEIEGKSIKNKVNNTIPYLSLDDKSNTYTFITGCNTLSGNLDHSKNKLTFKQGISTLMFCEDMSVEDGIKKVLTSIVSYKKNKQELQLIDKNNQVLVKLKKLDDKLAILTEGEWELDLLAEPGANVQALFLTTKPTIKFNTDGSVTGHSGCNRYTGTYKLNVNQVQFGPMAGTKMMCSSIEGENMYLKALNKINSISVNDKELTMIMGDIALLRFKKK